MRAAAGSASLGWLGAAAVAMGGGIWSMHFVAMLAFSLPGVDISYDPLLTLLSLAIPILVAAAAFVLVSRRSNALVVSGIGMGLAISGMHYTGMSAMRMAASIHYDPVWVVLSIAIAIGASIIALRLAFHMTSVLERISAGVVMGVAISGMHYAAMQGSSFVPAEAVLGRAAHGAVGQAPLAFLIAGTTVVVLIIGLAAAVYDRSSAERADREAEALRRSEERFRLLVEGVADHAIFMLDPEGRVANWNLGAGRLIGYGDEIVGTHYAILHTDEDRDSGIPEAVLLDAKPEDPRIHRLLDNAIQGALRGTSLTQRMLAFARKQDLKPVVVDVPELVRGMVALLKFNPGIRVETRFPIELAKVEVDANQLELAILNLAVNARDAIAAGGGVISIAAREEHAIDGLAEGRYVALSVSDTGSGT